MGDPGILMVVVLAAGIPLGFYVVRELIELLPRTDRNIDETGQAWITTKGWGTNYDSHVRE